MKFSERTRDYLNRLKWPDAWNDLADLFSKTVVAAMSAVIAAGVWVYSEREKERDAEQHSIEIQNQTRQKDIEHRLSQLQISLSEDTDRRDNVNMFLGLFPKDLTDARGLLNVKALTAYCEEELRSRKKGPLLLFLCKQTSEFGTQIGAKSARDVIRTGTTADYVGTSEATAQSVGLAASELAVGDAANPSPQKNQWFAVLASVPLSQPVAAAALAKTLNGDIGKAVETCDVQIYETKLSKVYAITSGPAKPEQLARERVRVVKALIPDAFAQVDRGWTLAPLQQPKRSLKPPCN
jgi:hypothetical protein